MDNYSEHTKAAVLAALLAGQSVSTIATEYNIPAGTIRSWKSRQQNGNSVASVATDKKERIGELLLEYLTSNLETLKVQQEVFREKDWLRTQSASDLAVLHGVCTDKAIRLLEALGAAETRDAAQLP